MSSRGVNVKNLAFSAAINDGTLNNAQKNKAYDAEGLALTNTYITGNPVRIEQTDIVSFQVFIDIKGEIDFIYALAEFSYDCQHWSKLHAGTTLLIPQGDPERVLQSELLPLRRLYAPLGDKDSFFMTYEVRAGYGRILLRADKDAPTSRVRAFLGT